MSAERIKRIKELIKAYQDTGRRAFFLKALKLMRIAS